MNKKILKEKSLMLPIYYQDISCEDKIRDTLQDYVNTLTKYSADSKLIECVKKFRTEIQKMFSAYYLGRHNRAYRIFRSAINDLLYDKSFFVCNIPDEPYYRARINENNIDYKENEMFHIPLDCRNKVSTQRFSFPGLPCLYLGTSAYVCWIELNRPSFRDFQVAEVHKNIKKEYKVVDLSLHPLALYNSNNKIELEKYLYIWPIIAASSIAVRDENGSFKPEYIFPQFMLQYVLEARNSLNAIGIKYMSIKAGRISTMQYESDPRTYTNYVFPIKSHKYTKDKMCSTLSSQFKITKNYSGRELEILSDLLRNAGYEIENEDEAKSEFNLRDVKLYDTNNRSYSYKDSIFGRIELVLANKDNNNISNKGKLILKFATDEDIDKLFS